jgi:hypothetical protein
MPDKNPACTRERHHKAAKINQCQFFAIFFSYFVTKLPASHKSAKAGENRIFFPMRRKMIF